MLKGFRARWAEIARANWEDLIGERALGYLFSFVRWVVAFAVAGFLAIAEIGVSAIARQFVVGRNIGYAILLGSMIFATIALRRYFQAVREAGRFHGLSARASRRLTLKNSTLFRVSLAKQLRLAGLDGTGTGTGSLAASVETSKSPAPDDSVRPQWSTLVRPEALAHRRHAQWFVGGGIAILVVGCLIAIFSTLLGATLWWPMLAAVPLYAAGFVLGGRSRVRFRNSAAEQWGIPPGQRGHLDIRGPRRFAGSLQVWQADHPAPPSPE